jgi:hypothetical protein
MFCILVASPAGGLTKGQLRSKLLSLSDLPAGWTVATASSGGGSAVSGGCLAGVKKAPKSEEKVTASFVNGQFPQLNEALLTGRSATVAYNRLNRVLARCKHFTVSSDGQTLTATVGAMSLPTVGDESNAYGVTFSFEGISGGVDLVLFKVGSIAGVVEYIDTGQPDPNQLQEFVNESVNKVEGKPTITPTTTAYQRVSSASGGYSLAVPKSWVVLDLSTDSLDRYRARLTTTYPRLANYFFSDIFANDTGLPYTDFFAADPADPAPTPFNVRAEHFSQPGSPVDAQADIKAVLRGEGNSNIDVRETSVAGLKGVIATGTYSVKSHHYRDTNVFVECHPNVQCVLVFIAPDNVRDVAAVNSMIQTLSIT